jgi:hypothetical protein
MACHVFYQWDNFTIEILNAVEALHESANTWFDQTQGTQV